MSDPTVDILDTICAIQEGDYETVQTVLQNRIVSPNAQDNDGCSLLHWSAINNRVSIAKLLVETGAYSCGGGALSESPLQWSLRRRYYSMAELLVEKLHVDLSHKSAQGLDALHLCCKLGDINAVYLLLNWGANPNSTDETGNSPLFSLLIGELTPLKSEMIRLLVRFGADVLIENQENKDTIFHILARKQHVDLSLFLDLYQFGKNQIPFMRNNQSLTPYTQSIHSENRKVGGFLFDIQLFFYFPYWMPSVLMAITVILGIYFIDSFGYFYGCLDAALLLALFYWAGFQQRIPDHRGRLFVGFYYGIGISLMCIFVFHVQYLLPSISTGITWTVFGALLWLDYKIKHSKPLSSRVTHKNEIARTIIDSSPSEGTDEENDALSLEEVHSSGKRAVKIIKDSFTGKVQIVNLTKQSTTAQNVTNVVRLRTLGPKLCGNCLCDKRLVRLKSHTATHNLRKPAKNGEFLDLELSCGDGVAGAAETFISIATHCNFCQVCVVDVDQHCSYLGYSYLFVLLFLL
jgi:hypothetical protein